MDLKYSIVDSIRSIIQNFQYEKWFFYIQTLLKESNPIFKKKNKSADKLSYSGIFWNNNQICYTHIPKYAELNF